MSDNKLIFVVDDDPFILNLVRKRLENKAYDLETFMYGEECLSQLDRKPDLIILDYLFMKPDARVMNGMEIFEKIREKEPDIPVIMLSGQDSGNIVLELARKGIEDYVIKDNELMDNLEIAITELFRKE
ncbi:MAG TPA: response regulator [Bacteroidetes bacterium]|nr:response regulator [Bacteroidota bacterium]